jgi:hypothetical protein
MERLMHEADLAWTLALAVKPHLDTVERNDIFVALGAGDTFSAMRRLLRLVAVKKICIGQELVPQCISWLEGHIQHDGQYFRRLIESRVSPQAVGVPSTACVERRQAARQPVDGLFLQAR